MTSSVQKHCSTLSVFVNSTCNCGPYLDPRKVNDLPCQYGPASLNRILRLSVQSLVDAALDQKQIFGVIRQGEGKVLISANYDNKSVMIRLPVIKKIDELWSFLEILLEELLCCENFYSKGSIEGGCTKCLKQEKVETTTPSTMAATAPSSTASKVECEKVVKRRWSEEEAVSVSPSTAVMKHPRKSVPAELEAATSTTQSEGPPKLPADPSEWSIEDVIQHIAFTDPALGAHAELFRKHVRDKSTLMDNISKSCFL